MDAEVDAGVRGHLQPGEAVRAAVWVSRPDGRTEAGLSRSELSPFRFRKIRPDRPGDRRGLHGVPASLAVGLDQHIRTVNDPRVLTLTDRRLLLLAKRGLFRRSARELRLLWQASRTALRTATDQGNGRLRLDFTDGSAVVLLTPVAGLPAFLDA